MAKKASINRVSKEMDSEKNKHLRSDYFECTDINHGSIFVGDLVTNKKKENYLVRKIHNSKQLEVLSIKAFSGQSKRQLEVGSVEKCISIHDIKANYTGQYRLAESSSGDTGGGLFVYHQNLSSGDTGGGLFVYHQNLGIDLRSGQVCQTSQKDSHDISREEAACLYRIENPAEWSSKLYQLRNILDVEDKQIIFYISSRDRAAIDKAEMVGVHDGWVRIKLRDKEYYRVTIDNVISPSDLLQVHSSESNWRSRDHKLDDIYTFHYNDTATNTTASDFGKLTFIVSIPRINETLFVLRLLQKSHHVNSELEEHILRELNVKWDTQTKYKFCKESDIKKCKFFIGMSGTIRGLILYRAPDGSMLDVELKKIRGFTNEDIKYIEYEWVPYLMAIQEGITRVKVVHNQQLGILEMTPPVKVNLLKDGKLVHDTVERFDEGFVVLQDGSRVTVDKVFCNLPKVNFTQAEGNEVVRDKESLSIHTSSAPDDALSKSKKNSDEAVDSDDEQSCRTQVPPLRHPLSAGDDTLKSMENPNEAADSDDEHSSVTNSSLDTKRGFTEIYPSLREDHPQQSDYHDSIVQPAIRNDWTPSHKTPSTVGGDENESINIPHDEQDDDEVDKKLMIQKLNHYLRARVVLSCQLSKTELRKGEEVLVPSEDNKELLTLVTIQGVTRQKIKMTSGQEFTIDNIFDSDYLDRTGLGWMENRLGHCDEETEYESGELTYYKKENEGVGIGILKWVGRIQWERDTIRLGIECLTESVKNGDNDSQFIHYRKIEGCSAIITEDQLISGAKVEVLVNDVKGKNGTVHERGSLWVKHDQEYHRVDGDGKIDELEGGRLAPVRDDLVRFIIKVEADKRPRLVLSQQLKNSPLEVGKNIRIADGDNLVRCSIAKVKDGLVDVKRCEDGGEFSEYRDEDRDECGPSLDDEGECFRGFEDGDFGNHTKMQPHYEMMKKGYGYSDKRRNICEVPLHNLYDDDYNTRRDMEWTADLLEGPNCTYKRGQMLYFKTESPTHYSGGILKYMLKTPWDDQNVFVIERCTDDDKFEDYLKPELVNFSFVYFDNRFARRIIVSEDQIRKNSELVVAFSEWKSEVGKLFKKGSLWIHEGDGYFLFDEDICLSDEREIKKIPEHLAQLMFAIDEDLRIPFLELEQLGGSELSTGDMVLVAKTRSQNANDLEEGVVKRIQYGKISVRMEDSSINEVTADRVYHKDFLHKLDIPGEAIDGDVVFWDRDRYPEKERYRLGRLLWRSSLPWERDCRCTVEHFSKFDAELVVRKEIKPVYFYFKRIGDAINECSVVNGEDVYKIGKGIRVYLLSGRSETGFVCELHCLLGNEKAKKVEKREVSHFMQTSKLLEPEYRSKIEYTMINYVPNELVRYFARIPQNILRLRFLKSKQLDINESLQVGRSVLIDCGKEDLKATTITHLENGLIAVEGNHVVTIDKVFDVDYREQKHKWAENQLKIRTEGENASETLNEEINESGTQKETYKVDDIVSFSQDKEIHIGYLKWKGSVPWLDSDLVGIECIREVSNDDELESCSGRRVHFVPVMDANEKNPIIVEENEIKKAEVVILQKKYQDFGIGTLWSKQESKLFNIEGEGEIDASALGKDETISISPDVLPFALKMDSKERRKVMLSGQLHELRLIQGEEVYVVKDPDNVTGRPEDLERTKITKVTNMDIEVEKFGKVELGRIFVSSYFSDDHSWTENCLGIAGQLQLTHSKYVEFKEDGKLMAGNVKWFGKVPWEDQMLVGIRTIDEVEQKDDKDFRYLHFLQLMHTDRKRSIIIPENQIDDDFLADPVQSPFAEIKLDEFPVGCFVSMIDGTPPSWWIGTVKWTGEYISTINTPLAVVVLNKKHDKGTAGRFQGISLVHCQPGKALLLSVKLLNRVPDFTIGDCVELLPAVQGPKCTAVVKWLEPNPNPKRKWSQNIGIQLKKRYRKSTSVKDKFECPDGYGMIVPAYKLIMAKETESLDVDPVPPISSENSKELIGENRGIQGFNNSCYLDTVLFSMFTFTSAFESRIPKDDPDVAEGRNLVLNGIVYPLRKNLFVPSSNTTSLRRLLAELSGDDAYLSKTRDIPECLEILFGKVLEISPWIRTVANNTNLASYHTEIFPFPDAKGIATSQLYLEFSAMFMDFRFSEKPSTLILQLQRQGNHNPKPMVPSINLDLTYCMANYMPKSCSICNSKNPMFRVDSRFDMQGLKSTFVCSDCAKLYPYSTPLRTSGTSSSATSADYMMKLTAVICIESSHYNCFVRCGDNEKDHWIFFDSMADQTPAGENIPKVIPVDLNAWIKQALNSKGELNPKSFYPDKSISERPFVHPYALIYQS